MHCVTLGLTDRFRVAEIRILMTRKTEGSLVTSFPGPLHLTFHSKAEDGEGAWGYDSWYCLITSTSSLSSPLLSPPMFSLLPSSLSSHVLSPPLFSLLSSSLSSPLLSPLIFSLLPSSLYSHYRLQLIYQCYNKLGLTVIQPEGNQLHITMHLVKSTGPLRAMCYPARKLQCIPPYIKSSLTSWTATHRLGFLSTPLVQHNMATLQQVQYSQEMLIIHLGATDATPCSVSNSHHLASPFSPPLDPPRVIVLPL